MNFSFIKTSYRNIVKDKFLSGVLVLGLIAGLTAITLVAVYLDFQFSFDKHNNNADKIYRILSTFQNKSIIYERAIAKYTDALNSVQGINSSTKVFYQKSITVKKGINDIKIEKAIYADAGFFKVFTHKFVSGSNKQLFANPYEAVITKTYAQKIWGSTNAVGKIFNFDDKDYSVKAVIDDLPINSHLKFNVALSFSSNQPLWDMCLHEFYTYFRIENNADENSVLNSVNVACTNAYAEYLAKGHPKIDFIFQPLLDIHLNPESIPYDSPDDKALMKILSVIGFCTLIILIMNFVNLLTVKFQNRFKEIGIRKIVGANKRNLIFQFAGESVIISSITALISAIAVAALIKPFGLFLDINLSDYQAQFYKIVVFLVTAGVFIGILSALIPIYKLLKNGNPLNILSETKSKEKNRMMTAAVLVQFSIISGLVSSLLVISSQVNFMKNKNLGFNKDQIIYFDNNSSTPYSAIITALEGIDGIKEVTAADTKPGDFHSGMSLRRPGADISEKVMADEIRIQKNYIATYGLEIIEGRDFIGTNGDEGDNIILNETAVKKLGYTAKSIINEKLEHNRGTKTVIGVVKDYNFASLHSKIEPYILSNYSPNVRTYSALINTNNYKDIVEKINNKIKTVDPNFKVEILFLSDFMNNLYKVDEKERSLIFYITLLCLVLSITGLIALASYTILKRTKEIGIRKVLGASVSNILLILYKDFLKLIILANIIIIPIVWLLISGWLDNYPFHVSLGMSYFIKTLFIVSILTIVTILYLASKAAFKNPVDTIKYE